MKNSKPAASLTKETVQKMIDKALKDPTYWVTFLLLEAIADKRVAKAIVQRAKKGDMLAAELVVNHVLPYKG